MVNIVFEATSQSFDDESGVVSGWNDVRLTPLGMDQSKQLGARYAADLPHAIFYSDIKRAEQTVSVAFDPNVRVFHSDWRLRDCDYGDVQGMSLGELDAIKQQHLKEPFPNGESYEQTVRRHFSFLNDLRAFWQDKTVLVIGHPSTLYSLEFLINQKPFEQSLSEPWNWQPGWKFSLI